MNSFFPEYPKGSIPDTAYFYSVKYEYFNKNLIDNQYNLSRFHQTIDLTECNKIGFSVVGII